MVSIWTLVRFVHVLSAMVWVGGQLLLSLLVLPVLRRRLDPASRAPLTREGGCTAWPCDGVRTGWPGCWAWPP